MKNGIPLITPDEALSLILERCRPLDSEEVTLFDVSGRILYEDIIADVNIPPFDNSAMDGYALTASAVSGASTESPATLPVFGEVRAGETFSRETPSGSAVRIMTGAPIPPGCDTVVPVEETSEENETVTIRIKARKGDHIRRAGEDIAAGTSVLRRGRRISSADAGLLASVNRPSVNVFRRPLVGIISTGDEIVEPGEKIGEGQIRNSNACTLYSEIRKYGALPRYIGVARDTREDAGNSLQSAMDCDIIITTGGVSMGKYDFITEALTELGIQIVFENIKMKPGKPCVFGELGGRLFFGLPGNPVSTLVSFIQFVRPAILSLMGATALKKPVVTALLEEPVSKKRGRVHYVRGFFTVSDRVFRVTTTGPQGSGILRSMSDANCLIILPTETEHLESGSEVPIQLINHEEIT